MKSAGGVVRLTLIMLALVVGVLGILRVLDIIGQETFQEWLLRAGGAVVIVGLVALLIQALKGKG